MKKGYYISDPRGIIKSPVYTAALKAKDVCADRNSAVKIKHGYEGDYYHVEEVEIDG